MTNKDVTHAVRSAIDLIGGIEKFVSPKDALVIKPNLVTAMPYDAGMTTDPRVVQTIIELCKGVNPSSIIIAEGSASVNTHLAFEKCGYSKLASQYNLDLVDINDCPTTVVDIPEGKGVQKLEVPNVLLEADVLINVPKLKLYRSEKWASLAIKNLVGAVPGIGEFSDTSISKLSLEITPELWSPDGKWYLPHYKRSFNPKGEKERLHMNLAESIVDLVTVIKPTLNVIDGMMLCRDPDITHYDPAPLVLNTVLAGADAMAVDTVGVKIAGMSPLDVSYLKSAVKRGIGVSDLNQIQVVGTPLKEIARKWVG